MEYMEHIDSLLEFLLSQESLNDGEIQCKNCWKGACAVWRFKDCSLGTPMWWACMRTSHRHNPFHQIERWTRKFYQPAKLWEVSAYLLVQHHVGTQLCRNLNRQLDFLEKVETWKDSEEQEKLRNGNQRWCRHRLAHLQINRMNLNRHHYSAFSLAPSPSNVPALQLALHFSNTLQNFWHRTLTYYNNDLQPGIWDLGLAWAAGVESHHWVYSTSPECTLGEQ